jgi:glyoxylase I family protein
MFEGLEHAGLASPDPERLAQWYVDTLGFVVNYTSSTTKTRFVRAPNGSMLEIIESKGERVPQGMKGPGIRHLAIAVKDFDAALAKLRTSGITFLTEPQASKGNKVVFFQDADGNILHLIERENPLP